MKSIKCSSCGANINVDNSKRTYKCPYCGTNFINENYEGNNEDINSFLEANENIPAYVLGPRPAFNPVIFLILSCFYFFPGIIYAIIIVGHKSVWDKFHNKNNIK